MSAKKSFLHDFALAAALALLDKAKIWLESAIFFLAIYILKGVFKANICSTFGKTLSRV